MNEEILSTLTNDLNLKEVNDYLTQSELDSMLSDLVIKQMKSLQEEKIKQVELDSMLKLKSISSTSKLGNTRRISSEAPIGGIPPTLGATASGSYGYTKVNDEIPLNRNYFNSLLQKTYIGRLVKVHKGNLDVELLVADILEFCSDEEVDELIARLTSDSEYLSRKGYNSINIKGD